jgi:PAS domain S-box-containing protein
MDIIFETIPDLIFCKDLNQRYTRCNRQFEQYFGLNRADVIGQDDYFLFNISPEQIPDYLSADKEVLTKRVTKICEERVYKNDGTYYLFETIKVPIIKDDKIIGLLGISRDVTERKAVEAAAFSASKVKSDFLARMSHEIRTPMNAIVGMSHIIKQSADDKDKVLSSINNIIMSSAHLLGLLNNILDMSKIEAGKFEIANEPFSICNAIDEVSSIIAQRCHDKNINFFSNSSKLPNFVLLGDKLRLCQILINLLGNAAKFTPAEGYIALSVDLHEETDNDVSVTFSVVDNGIGMKEEQAANLFKAFEQADNTISSRFGGTGLGLVISQNLANMMGGCITVKSIEGEGSVFEFTLKFAKSDRELVNKEVVLDIDLKGKRILIVEDIEINRVITKEILLPAGVIVEEAVNGAEAVKMFERSPINYYNLIFMDIQMPIMNGYEATGAIRALEREDAQSVPIIAMTANAYSEDVKQSIQSGMNDHIAKPIDVQTIFMKLNTFLNR